MGDGGPQESAGSRRRAPSDDDRGGPRHDRRASAEPRTGSLTGARPGPSADPQLQARDPRTDPRMAQQSGSYPDPRSGTRAGPPADPRLQAPDPSTDPRIAQRTGPHADPRMAQRTASHTDPRTAQRTGSHTDPRMGPGSG